jgi:hypothetical protein
VLMVSPFGMVGEKIRRTGDPSNTILAR